MRPSLSVASENFIKTVYQFERLEGRNTRPGTIARKLGITNAAATDMARKLATKKLLDYEKYKELKLTPAGEKMALAILRRHRLWETFLHRVLGLSMHEIHREAEMLEHVTSDFLTDRIDSYLGNPSTDPHGDPIPDERGDFTDEGEATMLSLAPAGSIYTISRLSGSDREFFDFCHTNRLMVGASVSVTKQYDKNGMTEIEVEGTRLLLPGELAATISVKQN